MTPETIVIALSVALVLVSIAFARIRGQGGRNRQAHWVGPAQTDVRAASTGLAPVALSDPPTPAASGATRVVPSGTGRARPAPGVRAETVEEPNTPRVQLLRDASAVMLAIIAVILVGSTIFTGRDGAVAGVTSAPGQAEATADLTVDGSPIVNRSPDPGASGGPLPGAVIPSLEPSAAGSVSAWAWAGASRSVAGSPWVVGWVSVSCPGVAWAWGRAWHPDGRLAAVSAWAVAWASGPRRAVA